MSTLSKAQWDGLTPDDIRKSRPDLVTTFAGAAQAPVPASLEDLETAFKGENEFILTCLRGKLSIDAAHQKYSGTLRDRLSARETELAELRTKGDTPTTPTTVTTEAPASGSTAAAISKAQGVVKHTAVVDASGLPAGATPGGGGKAECPHKTFKGACLAIKTELRCSESKASAEAAKRWPELVDK